jgi:DNA-directed RNA polymerase subunit beta
VKSDDVVGRVKAYEAIIKGENIPRPGMPEGFKVLIKEFQSLGIDVKIIDEEDQEFKVKEAEDEDDISASIHTVVPVENSGAEEDDLL